MQRWFFLEEPKRPKFKPPQPSPVKEKKIMAEILSQQWVFTVAAPDVHHKEKVFITGNIPELGEWDYKRLLLLDNQEGTDLWSVTITIPNIADVLYRYGLAILNEDSQGVIISQWETSIRPRIIKTSTLHPLVDTYGQYDGIKSVTSGWLTTHNLLQFKFMKCPLQLKSRLAERPLYIKVTPVKLSFGNDPQIDETSLSTDTMDNEVLANVLVEVSTLNNDPTLCTLKPQEQFGREYKPNDILLVNMTILDLNALAYLVDFYSFSSRASANDPPGHVGYTYILPNMLRPSEGSLQLPVTCNIKHRPLGSVHIEYLIVRPLSENLNNLQVSYAKYWNPKWTGLEVGHRGLGASFKTKGNSIRENTIASLKKAAASGADMLEFDVQLSKDMVPVIYHDFHVCISMKRKKEVNYAEMLEIPVKDLSLEHLQKLKVYHLAEGRNNVTLFFDEDLEEHQPFPTLELALNTIDIHVGFNVELKWTMQMEDGTFELNNPFDMNTYVDKVLEVVLKHAGNRRIVFSCFNPDICTMVRNKQNKYPVMFLTVGITKKYDPYKDPRCTSIAAAVQTAVSADILGIVVHTEDLLRDPTQVKLATDAGLVTFCWGDDNNDKTTIQMLKSMGLHAVIYDKLDEYTSKEIKESVFLMEARESQRDLISLAALDDASLSQDSSPGQSVDFSTKPSAPTAYLDLHTVRNKIQENSVATSLESLASSIDLRDDADKNLKRNRNIISNIDKDSQVKEQVNAFKDIFGKNSKGPPKKSRLD